MQTENGLGFVVWGVKNGFQNSMFSYKLSDTVKDSLVDIQELCMPCYSDFYSIESLRGYSIVSLYDPTVMDYSGSRKAYIVFSIIFASGTFPVDNVFELLKEFKNYYKVESNGIPSQEIFQRKMASFKVRQDTRSFLSYGSKIGYKYYNSQNEIQNIFSSLDSLDFRKIYFFDRENIYVTSNPNFIAVESLVRVFSLMLKNFNELEYQILVNRSLPNSNQLQIDNSFTKIINLQKNDRVEIKSKAETGGKVIIEKIVSGDEEIDLSFYKKKSEPISPDNSPEDKSQDVNDAKDKKRNILQFFIVFLIFLSLSLVVVTVIVAWQKGWFVSKTIVGNPRKNGVKNPGKNPTLVDPKDKIDLKDGYYKLYSKEGMEIEGKYYRLINKELQVKNKEWTKCNSNEINKIGSICFKNGGNTNAPQKKVDNASRKNDCQLCTIEIEKAKIKEINDKIIQSLEIKVEKLDDDACRKKLKEEIDKMKKKI